MAHNAISGFDDESTLREIVKLMDNVDDMMESYIGKEILEGKYMAFAQKASSSATSYTTMLCFSRANSIYDEYGVNLGCNLIGNWYTLKNFKIGSISAGGYTAFSGAIPIVCEITNNGNSWTYSHLRVYNGIIVGYWN